MKYNSHTNPTEVHCHKCGDEITLKSQFIEDSVILCEPCYTEDFGTDDDDL